MLPRAVLIDGSPCSILRAPGMLGGDTVVGRVVNAAMLARAGVPGVILAVRPPRSLPPGFELRVCRGGPWFSRCMVGFLVEPRLKRLPERVEYRDVVRVEYESLEAVRGGGSLVDGDTPVAVYEEPVPAVEAALYAAYRLYSAACAVSVRDLGVSVACVGPRRFARAAGGVIVGATRIAGVDGWLAKGFVESFPGDPVEAAWAVAERLGGLRAPNWTPSRAPLAALDYASYTRRRLELLGLGEPGSLVLAEWGQSCAYVPLRYDGSIAFLVFVAPRGRVILRTRFKPSTALIGGEEYVLRPREELVGYTSEIPAPPVRREVEEYGVAAVVVRP